MPDAFSNITALLEMQQYRWPNQNGCGAVFCANTALLLNNISIFNLKNSSCSPVQCNLHLAMRWICIGFGNTLLW